jgi:hypothetical protein
MQRPAPASSTLTPPILNGASSLALSAASSSLSLALIHSRLLGISLVVSGDFGTRAVFRYPVNRKDGNGAGGEGGRGRKKGGAAVGGGGGAAGGRGIDASSRDISAGAMGLQSSSSTGSLNDAGSSVASSPVLSGAKDPSDDEDAKPSGPPNSASATSASSSSVAAAQDEMYGMSPDEFARLFCPKVALCSRVLDVSVDGLRFISYPIRLRYDESRSFQARERRRRERERQRRKRKMERQGLGRREVMEAKENGLEEKKNDDDHSTSNVAAASTTDVADSANDSSTEHPAELDSSSSSSDDGDTVSEHELTFFNVVFILSGGVSAQLAARYGHVAAQLGRALLHEQTRVHFVSQQAQLLVSIREKYLNAVARSNQQRPAGQKAAVLDFHALSHLLLSHSLLANHLHQLYYGLLQQEYERFGQGVGGPTLGAASFNISSSSSTLSSAAAAAAVGVEDTHGLATHVRTGAVATASAQEGVAQVTAAFAKLGAQLTSNHHPNVNGQNASAQLQPVSSQQASLIARNAAARLLQVDHTHTTLLLNNWLPLHFSLSALPAADPTSINSGHSGMQPSQMVRATSTPSSVSTMVLRPYQTLLLTVSAPLLLQSLPTDASPLLRRLISHADPRLTFHELSLTLKVEVKQLYKLVVHLVYWGKGLIVDAVSGDNYYALSDKCATPSPIQTTTGKMSKPGGTTSSTAAGGGGTGGGNGGMGTQRRSSSVRPAGVSFASSSIPSSSGASTTGGSSLRQRRRSSSVESSPPVSSLTPAFLPPTLLYEWCLHFPHSGAAGLVGMIGRLAQRETRSVKQHLTKVASMAIGGGGGAGAGANLNSASGTAAAKLRHALQADFLAQLVFLLRKGWLVQVHRWFLRIGSFDGLEDLDDVSTDEENDDPFQPPPMSTSSSRASLRSMASESHHPHPGLTDINDPWRTLLERLTPLYFDGQHTLTEILWSERESGLTQGHLQHLITLFPKQLISLAHP